MKNIGVDVGGTFIKFAIVEKNGKIIASGKTPSPKNGKDIPKKIVEFIWDMIVKEGISLDEIYSVGVGTTGVCDSKNGVVLSCPNIEGYENIEVCKYIKETLGKDAYLDNDANCAALGEYMLAETKPDSFVFVTLGTGVGGGIVLNGKLLRGINSAAGEIGHIVLKKDGERCNCGRVGCWERYASVSALVRQTKNAGFTGDVTGRTAFEKSLQGDKKAQEVIDKWVSYVAEGVCDMVNIFQPDLVVIGGGVSREGDRILSPVREFVKNNSMTGQHEFLKQTEIVVSKLFNDAGVIGASFLYTQK